MKKVQYNYLPADSSAPGGAENNKMYTKMPATKSNQQKPPTEETVARLNAIAREYPFCAHLKQTGSSIL